MLGAEGLEVVKTTEVEPVKCSVGFEELVVVVVMW